MKVFVAGATGAIGRLLLPRLVESGHEVVGMTRSEEKGGLIWDLGARPVIADALDPEAVGQVVSEAAPDVIVHQLTALSGDLDFRRFERTFAQTNRLRTEGTDHLLSAARAAGVRRFIAQSFAGWPFERSGPSVKTEEDPLDPEPPAAVRTTAEAIRYLERAVTEADWLEGIVLRYGGFYGPGTSITLHPESEQVEMIRKRKFPIVGSGAGVWSFIHIADAAEATALAVEQARPGIYHVVDDSPAPVSRWLPEFAEAIDAAPPRRVPRWLGRLVAGQAAAVMMTEIRGASNAKARNELGWRPRYPSLVEAVTAGGV